MKETQVVIAGGGPVGMTLAHDLASRGIRCLVAERNQTTTSHPKMDITNSRSMELFRRAGLAEALRQVAVPEDHCVDVSWITSFSGVELHRFKYPSVAEARANYRRRNDGTDPAEPPMRVSQVEIEPVLRRAIEASPLVEVRFGLEFESYEQDADGVTVSLRRKDDDGVEQVRCLYLAGCDGGSSRVRTQSDIQLSGQSHIGPRFMTHFRSDAADVLLRWGNAWHYQSNLGTLISQNDRDVWTLHSRVPQGITPDLIDPREMVFNFVGREIPMEVLVANPWNPHLLVADSYRRGRVFLAGDAAHQYIPTGGYGMNTGVGDAFDLAWKLAAVIQGWGGVALLDAYDPERRPVGIRNCNAARRNNEIRVEIARLYGTDIRSKDAEGDQARAHAAAEIARIGNAENESVGIEMGFRYLGSPILPDGPEDDLDFDPVRYTARTDPGVRLPNVFLDDGSPIHDHLGPWYTLLQFSAGAGGEIPSVCKELGIPLTVVTVPAKWQALYGAPAILVRPDMHIAWRGEINGASDAAVIVKRATGRQLTSQAVARIPLLVTA